MSTASNSNTSSIETPDTETSQTFANSAINETPSSNSFSGNKLLQWNLLADGLGSDGFLIMPENGMVTDIHGVSITFAKHLKEISSAKGNESELAKLKVRYNTPELKQLEKDTLAWETRFPKMIDLIKQEDPSIVTLQENDRFAEFKQWLQSLGYSCSLGDNAKTEYIPISELSVTNMVPSHQETGCTFIAKPGSNAQKFAKKLGNHNADNDGTAIFVHRKKFKIQSITYGQYGPLTGKSGFIVVELLNLKTEKIEYVVSTHLTAGDSANDERKRVAELRNAILIGKISLIEGKKFIHPTEIISGGLVEYLNRLQATGCKVTLALDANSRPGFVLKDADGNPLPTVWSILNQTFKYCVWDAYYNKDGSLKDPSKDPHSTAKMRGPNSDQPLKIGELCKSVIDYVFSNFPIDCIPPLVIPSDAEVLEYILPSASIPSDHFPVIAYIQ